MLAVEGGSARCRDPTFVGLQVLDLGLARRRHLNGAKNNLLKGKQAASDDRM